MKIYQFNGKPNICGSSIRSKRKELHITQAMLAAKMQILGISISRDTISRIERDKRIVTDFELLGFMQCLSLETKVFIDALSADD